MKKNDNLLEVNNGSFFYEKGKNIFEEVNFELKKGEIFCILGPNGCGKTTLLKCLTGINKLKKGNILIKNKNISSLEVSEIAKNIGYIPQGHNSTFPYTVLDVVLMGRSSHLKTFESPGAKDIKIAENSIKSLNIDYLKDVPYNEISGGEQQLTFIARVLTQKPEILILDEPTSHLDFGNQIRTLNMIKDLSENGLSIIMTSHFPDHAFIAGDRVGIMKNKKFIEVGRPVDVITSENMKNAYGINVKILDIGERLACIPLSR
jgi:iron complex transport system ATP-binding protein